MVSQILGGATAQRLEISRPGDYIRVDDDTRSLQNVIEHAYISIQHESPQQAGDDWRDHQGKDEDGAQGF